MREEVSKEMKEGILQRITSPWFFTFIPWWVVFNYDFLLRIVGKFETAQKINEYYCAKDLYSTVERFTIFGCINRFDDWHPAIWKLGWPLVATVVSMVGIAWFISWVQEVYHLAMKRDWLWQIKYKNTLYENGTLKSKVHFLESKMQEMEDKMLHIKEKIEEIAPETSEGYCSYSDFDIIGDSPSSTKIHKRVKRKAKTKK